MRPADMANIPLERIRNIGISAHIDSGKGVQSQSITVDKQMKRYKVPRIAFVNKMDNPGANYARVADMLKEKLGHHPVKLQVPMGAEDRFVGLIDPIIGKAYFFE